MNDPLSGVQIALVALFAAANVLLVLLIAWQARRLRSERQAGEALARELAAVQCELRALCAGAAGVGAHLARLDTQCARLGERQDRLELSDTMHREYDRAVKLIREGAGAEQVMDQCHLTRAEAELLLRMQNSGASADARPQRRVGAGSGAGMRVSGLPM